MIQQLLGLMPSLEGNTLLWYLGCKARPGVATGQGAGSSGTQGINGIPAQEPA